MAMKAKYQRKVRIGGTIDNDVLEWLMKTRGKEKFSTHLNSILRQAMDSGIRKQGRSLEKFHGTLSIIEGRINKLQERLKTLEASKEIPEKKRGRGRPRKVREAENVRPGRKESYQSDIKYNPQNDVNWFMSNDRYKKIKPEPLVNALNYVISRFENGNNITVGMLAEGFDRKSIGVPFPTFRLFYFPMIRDRLMEKKIIEKVDKPGKKGVYKKHA
ncbi:MAG TPA: hypothetical protein VK436_14390 [Methanocella sp.]|nr:hypothetical protein [Methanocella sp.]